MKVPVGRLGWLTVLVGPIEDVVGLMELVGCDLTDEVLGGAFGVLLAGLAMT